MLSHTFNDIILTIFGFVFFTSLWNFYYLYINVITKPQTAVFDKTIQKNINVTNPLHPLVIILIVFWFFLLNFIYTYIFSISTSFWDTLQLSNNTLNFLYLSAIVLLLILGSINSLKKQNWSFSVEYILFLFIIIINGYLLLSSTNLFVTIFFLEFIALLIFGKFTVSKLWVKSTTINNNVPVFINQYSYGLFNSLFFQFWANFVSSVFLFFSLINMHYICGTSNFYLVNFLLSIMDNNNSIPTTFIIIVVTMFITGLFIKLGLSPYQFFKIETYKGIPIFMVVVYTTLYLLIYIYFFIYLLFYQLPIVRIFTGSYMLMFITLSLLYLISLLFDTKNFKAFLSYSTLITIINLFIVILLI